MFFAEFEHGTNLFAMQPLHQSLINFDTYIIFLYHKYDAKQKIDYKLTGSSSYSSCQDKSN